VFAETYDQHLKNVARWRDLEREQREAAAAAEAAGGAPVPTSSQFLPTPTMTPGSAGRAKQGPRPTRTQ
jgi:hypothetical protein